MTTRLERHIQRHRDILQTKKEILHQQEELQRLQSELRKWQDFCKLEDDKFSQFRALNNFTRPTKEELEMLFKQRLLDTSEEAQKRRAVLLVKANILDEQGRYVERFFSEETLKNDKKRQAEK